MNDDYPVYRQQVYGALGKVHNSDVRVLGDLDQEQLRDAYYGADVTVIPSLLEATSLAGLESLACGVPVLATNVGGLPDIVSHGKMVGWCRRLIRQPWPQESFRWCDCPAS